MVKVKDTVLRDQIATRLRALQRVAGVTDEQMGDYVGISREAWNNATRSPTDKPDDKVNKPRPEVMIRLCERSHVTMDWIYRGIYDHMPYVLAKAIQEELARGPGTVRTEGRADLLPGLVEVP